MRKIDAPLKFTRNGGDYANSEHGKPPAPINLRMENSRVTQEVPNGFSRNFRFNFLAAIDCTFNRLRWSCFFHPFHPERPQWP
jgi:hypothetical protein